MEKPARGKQSSREPDEDRGPSPRYIAVPLHDIVAVLIRASREGKIHEALEVLRRSPRSRESLLVSESQVDEFARAFKALALCSGGTGTWGPPTAALTLVRDTTAGAAAGTVPAGQSRITVGFTYTTGATGTCVVKIDDVRVALRGGTFSDVTPASDDGSSYTGTTLAPAARFAMGMPVQVDIYFSGSRTGWCDTCAAAGATSVTVIGTVT